MTDDIHISLPTLGPSARARIVRGHRMGPLKDGWMVVYDDLQRIPVDALAGELCVVMTADDRCLVRIMAKGGMHRWDLLTSTGDQELNVELKWAEPVTLIVPVLAGSSLLDVPLEAD